MLIFDEDRAADSAFIERVWRCHSEGAAPFLSIAARQYEFVVGRIQGQITCTLRGPETHATPMGLCPDDGEWVGIVLKFGVCLPHVPAHTLRDAGIDLPMVARDMCWFRDTPWRLPDFDNAETFIARLASQGLVALDPVIGAALDGTVKGRSWRTIQRHFVRATGLTQGEATQIERARLATYLLKQGDAIPDVIHQAGYFDQAHFTRALKRFIGQTPRQIRARSQPEQMSLLYKTASQI
jgi:hypothetical protein